MMKRMFLAGIASVLVVGFCAGFASAQEPARTKAELIKELLEVTGLSKQSSRLIDTMFDNMELQLPQMLEAIAAADPSLTPEQRQYLKTTRGESMDRFNKVFREKLKQRVNFGQVM